LKNFTVPVGIPDLLAMFTGVASIADRAAIRVLGVS
jgi:hypothetical protein